jgi:hypothetical protein
MNELIEIIKCPKGMKKCDGLPIGENYVACNLYKWGEILESVDGYSAEINCPDFSECYSLLVKQTGRYRRSAELKIQH